MVQEMMVSVMAMSMEEWREIEAVLGGITSDSGLVGLLRHRFPQFAWTSCDASDVDETPYRSYGPVDVHLLNTVNHCVVITSNPMDATGIILARKGLSS